jgi:hypothetical protein
MKAIKAKIEGEGRGILLHNPAGTGHAQTYPEIYPEIDLTDRKLGQELLNDASGDLPLVVWDKYLLQHNVERSQVGFWSLDPDDPQFAPIDPQQAVDEAGPLVSKGLTHLMSDSPRKAMFPLMEAIYLLAHGSSPYQRGRGLAASMQHQAVRAWVIRKFNRHPEKPGESTVGWARLADLLFLKDGKCPRKNRDYEICDASEHRYDSPCVKALMTAVGNLKSAMKRDGIPI